MTTLATLTGSEKQITWATEIRANFLQMADTLQTWLNQSPEAQADVDFVLLNTIIDTVRNAIATQTDSSWFIDNRRVNMINGLPSLLPRKTLRKLEGNSDYELAWMKMGTWNGYRAINMA